MAKGTFTDKDMGFGKLMTKFESGAQSAVFVGFLRSSGVYQGRKGKPMTMAQLGAIHEFGAPNAGIPERSFMRSAVDGGRSKIERLIDKLTGQAVDGKIDENRALGILGEFVKNLMKMKIQAGLKPALSRITIRRKGSSKPLIDTGQLINSIDWQVMPVEKKK